MVKRKALGLSMYAGKKHIEDSINQGEHRLLVGGAWEEIGALQLEILRSEGLQPSHNLLDIGCGSLRLGVKAVDYLEENRYWGTDLHASLLGAGYERELVPVGLDKKLPRAHLVEDGDFEFPSVASDIDYAIATSVFTHLPLNHLRLCLRRLFTHTSSQCRFLFSVFLAPSKEQLDTAVEQIPGGPITNPHRDPYHCLSEDVSYLAQGTGWQLKYLGGCNHPRGQKFFIADKT